MRLVLAYQTFASLGGSTTYLLTVAEHLERLGHEVTIFTHEPGEIAQDSGTAYRLARALAAPLDVARRLRPNGVGPIQRDRGD